MPYQQEFDFVGYQAYGQAQQTQTYQASHEQFQAAQQHPIVVIPQQPRQSVSQYYTPPQSFQPQIQPDLYQQYTPQNKYATQQQHSYPQSQQFYSAQQRSFQPQTVPNTQFSTTNALSQTSYQQNQFVDPRKLYSGVQAAHRLGPWEQTHVRQQVQQAPIASQLPSSPDPLSTPQYQVQSRVPPVQLEQRSQSQAVKPQQRSQSTKRPFVEPQPARKSSQQRVVAHVEIPVQQSYTKPLQDEMERSPKRRRSNEGHAVPVCEPPKSRSRQRSSQQHLKQQPVSSPLTELASSQLPPTPKPDLDHQAVLWALADDYVTAAYGVSASLVASDDSDERHDEVHALISIAMGCLESALTNYKQPDFRTEARLRLRLATLMAEETENDQEIEELLSKGIALCERSRFLDLKYAMHHLLVRVTFKTSPKAALKYIDKLVHEVEALKLTHWIYTFRFLRVSLSLEAKGASDTATVLKHLSSIADTAEESHQPSVQIIAAVLEAIVHIRSGSRDAAELAQRVMAAARTHQLGPEMKQMPQARALLDCLDVACGLIEFNQDQVAAKMQQMQTDLDLMTREPGWHRDGSINVSLSQVSNNELEKDTCGIMRRSSEGDATLVFRWIPKIQLYAIGYMLSGVASISKSLGQTERFIDEGVKLASSKSDPVAQSLTAATHGLEQKAALGAAMQLQTISMHCVGYDWVSARKAIQGMRQEYAQTGLEIDTVTARTLQYLEALSRHGLGELQTALRLYDSPELNFRFAVKAASAEKDLRALATLNSIFILRTLGPEGFVKAETLTTAVESYCTNHSNKAIKAVYFIIKATGATSNTAIIKMKQYLQAAVDASKTASNNQLLSICMNIMTATFFTNIVGDQAEKSAKAGRSLAKKGQDKLWTVVADGMFGDIMERCGKPAEAEAARKEARTLMFDLPEILKSSLRT